ncbi:LuxR family maltose regulon positive regulatory protein [Actinoplanes octamycinicus]|uniref:LuxR family maltose regulon positive regulatory protein n=1 Tax=Actinoplanes octamycinicus TaxID=135948 RepID=A0A7W7H6W6_9ACTN|nr:LuxR C-terminal-related transcriptional regulator [Actinoplanes octamycinicus]MBB4745116.1 LuxR family maltose regulon positive regulatory protein [Actinoplanes octamycinicus]GIE55700.1 LuxR family transcriptional regulator [Actinoplanes octamycinicus]
MSADAGTPDRVAPAVLQPLVAAKTSRPRTIRAGVARRRLHELLDAAAGRPVTLVCAGAGWGKTTGVSGWAQERDRPVAWLSVDRHDNDPQVFWAYLLAALRVAGAVPAGNPLADLTSVPADPRERGRLFAAGLARLSADTVLVVDDIQEIDDADVLHELADLLRHPPPPLRLLLVGRTEPPLRLHRLRAAGQLAEIRAEHLAFGHDEAAEIVGRHGLALSAEEMSALVARTEGWATGLQLAATFLAGHGGTRTITDFAGDVRGVDDYLTEEVLADRTRRQRRFLLQTSICENVCAGLADAITQRTDGQRILEELEHDNDFVVRLGAKPLWFRYHQLLRDVLGHRLRVETPGVLPDLHRRAARWHAANNSVLEALAHAVSARDWAFVGRLVTAQAAPLMVSAHRPALVKILRRVPAERLTSTPELLICAALLLFHAGDYDAIPARLFAARELLHGRPDAVREPVEIMARTLQLAADRAAGDMPALLAGANRLLDLVAQARTVPVPAVAQNRAIALGARGVALLWSGRTGEAERELWAGANAARAAGVELPEVNATGHLALLKVMSGAVHEAAALAGGAVDLAEQRGWRYALQTVPAYFALALVRLERHDLDGARQALQDGLRGHHSDPEVSQRLVSLGVQARLAIARGNVGAARRALDEARQDRHPRLRVRALERWLARTEAAVEFAAGADPGDAEPLLAARAAYLKGDVRQAQRLLGEVTVAERDTVGRVEAGILAALLADARGQSVRAADLLADAVTRAAEEGIRRPFLIPADPRLDGLLQRMRLLAPLVADFVGELRPARAEQPAESLSERETEVLRYLATMLTAAEIAADLGVSVNTVKAHMRAVYRKLGASRRTEAVTLAQNSGLL